MSKEGFFFAGVLISLPDSLFVVIFLTPPPPSKELGTLTSAWGEFWLLEFGGSGKQSPGNKG